MDGVQRVICLLLDLYFVVLIVRLILFYVPALPEPVQPVARGVRALTDPLLLPLRSALPPLRIGSVALDLSLIVVFFGVRILQFLLC